MSERVGDGHDAGADLHASPITLALPTVWLVFLVVPFVEVWGERTAAQLTVGVVAAVLFAAVYTLAFELARRARARRSLDLEPQVRWAIIVAMVALMVVMGLSLGQAAEGTVVFTAVTMAMVMPGLQPAVAVPALAGLTFVTSVVADGWTMSYLMPLVALAAGFVMWGIRQILQVNFGLLTMRDVQRELAREQERTRFGRDLHDILGHSMTVIAVKAELARRLVDTDPAQARRELDEVETLSRDALADIRRAVSGYHELSLPAELARARQALSSARIEAVVPNAVEHVSGPARELFAWGVREGVTNVIRHSRASRCEVAVDTARLTVADDGVGVADREGHRGNGLRGLASRAEAVGAVVRSGSREPKGFELVVEFAS